MCVFLGYLYQFKNSATYGPGFSCVTLLTQTLRFLRFTGNICKNAVAFSHFALVNLVVCNFLNCFLNFEIVLGNEVRKIN